MFSFPMDIWKNIKNQKLYLEWLGSKLGIKELDDWCKTNINDFHDNYGLNLLNYYKRNHVNLLKAIHPEHDWKEWLFEKTTGHFYDNKENKIRYLTWLGERLGYKNYEDWYGIKYEDILNNYGSAFAKKYKSVHVLIMENFLNHDWLEWKFYTLPRGFWYNKENRKKYMEWLRGKLKYQTYEDWYQLTRQILNDNYGNGILRYYKSISTVVTDMFPEHNWDKDKFIRTAKHQKIIYKIIKNKYPDAIWNHRHLDLRFSVSNYAMELDIFIPSINTAIEYQGQQHYKSIEH